MTGKTPAAVIDGVECFLFSATVLVAALSTERVQRRNLTMMRIDVENSSRLLWNIIFGSCGI